MSYFQTPLHSHILFLRSFSQPFPTHPQETFYFRCGLCREDIVDGTSIYCCEKCGFNVHKSCAGLSRIQHPRHEHPLDLRHAPYGFFYECVELDRGCGFELGLGTAIATLWVETYYCSMLQQEAGDGESRPRLAHAHPLTSFPVRRGIHCGGCGLQVSEEEEAYGCGDCNFFLHEACAKAPLVAFHHPFHPEHRLHLRCCPGDLACRICGTSSSIGYSCRNCEFFLDLSCVISTMPCEEDDDEGEDIRRRSSGMDHNLHPHQLSFYHSKTQTKIKCEICKDQIPSGDFFGCSDCRFFLDASCAQPPPVIQHYLHPEHPLTFAQCPESVEKAHECRICEYPVRTESYCYACGMCDVFIHQTCASATLSDLEKGAGMTAQCSFHEHDELKLCYNYGFFGNCTVCEGTIEKRTLAYKCFSSQGCSFKLHKSCAQLPSELEHPSHSLHLLALRFKPPDEDINCLRCHWEISGPFAFSCGECNFYLHVDCAQMPTLKHPSHGHVLFFHSVGELPIKRFGKSFWCRACLKTCNFNFFRCSQCQFNLHYECSQLPPTVKSEHHCGQLVLRQSFIEDGSGEYYCAICKRRRDPKKWVYSCETCNYKFVAHIKCALSPVKLEVIEEDDVIRRNEDIQRRKEKIKLAQEQVDAEEESLKSLLAKLESMRAKLESERAELKVLKTERAKWIDMEAIKEEEVDATDGESGSTDLEEYMPTDQFLV